MVGGVICYDGNMPEVVRDTVMKGGWAHDAACAVWGCSCLPAPTSCRRVCIRGTRSSSCNGSACFASIASFKLYLFKKGSYNLADAFSTDRPSGSLCSAAIGRTDTLHNAIDTMSPSLPPLLLSLQERSWWSASRVRGTLLQDGSSSFSP